MHPNLPRPTKKLGQHFLTDKQIVDRIIDNVNPDSSETIVEIGPGRGALTKRLLEQAGRVVAIEFDRNLNPYLQNEFRSRENFKLVQGDALVTDICAEILPANRARVVANLPYNVATAILQRLIVQRNCLTEMTLMLQREVVERITAPAGSRERGYLSVFVEAYCHAEKLFDVAPSSFRPAPKVWSTVVKLRFRSADLGLADEQRLWEIVSAGFAQRRKTILNNLRQAPAKLQSRIEEHGGSSIVLCQAGIDLKRRAETLTLEEWVRIAQTVQ